MVFKLGKYRMGGNIETPIFYLSFILYVLFSDDAYLISFSKLSLFAFFAVMLVGIFAKGGNVAFGVGAKIAACFLTLCVLSILWSYDQISATGAISTEVQLVVMFFFVYWYFNSVGRIENYFNALFFSGVALAAYTMIKYGGPAPFLAQMLTGKRMGGLIQNENTFGLNFTYACIISFYYYIQKNKLSYLGFSLMFAFFALSSGSKKAAFFIIIGFFGALISKYGLKRLYKIIVPAIVFLFAIIWAVKLPLFATVIERIEKYLLGTAISDSARETMREFGLDMIAKRPILGWGLRGFQQIYPTRQYSHDNFIEVTVSLGFLGMINYYLLYVVPILGSIKQVILKSKKNSQTYLVLLFLVIVDFAFGYGMVQFYARFSWILLAVTLASYEKLIKGERTENL